MCDECVLLETTVPTIWLLSNYKVLSLDITSGKSGAWIEIIVKKMAQTATVGGFNQWYTWSLLSI